MDGLNDLSRLVRFLFTAMGEFFSSLPALGVFGAVFVLVPVFRRVVRLMRNIFS